MKRKTKAKNKPAINIEVGGTESIIFPGNHRPKHTSQAIYFHLKKKEVRKVISETRKRKLDQPQTARRLEESIGGEYES